MLMVAVVTAAAAGVAVDTVVVTTAEGITVEGIMVAGIMAMDIMAAIIIMTTGNIMAMSCGTITTTRLLALPFRQAFLSELWSVANQITVTTKSMQIKYTATTG